MLQAPFPATDLKVEAGFSLDALHVDPLSGYIDGPGGREEVDPRVMEVLVALACHTGDLVSRQQLMEEVWGNTVVSDETLTQCVYQLRRHLETAADDKKYHDCIKTLPKRGYLLSARVLPGSESDAEGQPSGRIRWVAAGVLTILAALLLSWMLMSSPDHEAPSVVNEPAGARPTVAVLPFTDLSPQQDLAYFTAGISEEILHQLGNYEGLQVIARNSSFSFLNSNYPIEQISELLGAQYLLEGSVRNDGDLLKINARLLDQSGIQQWSVSLDRKLEEIFDIQEEIARAVATNVTQNLVPQATNKNPININAYQHYLVGREILHSQVPNWDNLAIAELREAVRIAPDYAEAYAELAIALTYARDREWHLRTQSTLDEKRREAENAIDTAFSLNPNLARAFAARGFLQAVNGETAMAQSNLRQALALDPNMADASNWLVSMLLEDENAADPWDLLVNATRRDPLFPALNTKLAWGYAQKGDTDQAQRTFERLLAVPEPAEGTYQNAQLFFENTGQFVKATNVAKRLVMATASTSRREFGLNHLAEAYASLGMGEAAEHWLDKKRRNGFSEYFDAFVLERQGRYRDILALWERLRAQAGIALADQDIPWIGYYGTMQALAGDIQAAITTLETVVTEDTKPNPVWGDPRVSLAFAYMKAGASDKAQPLIERLMAEWYKQQSEGLLNFGIDLVDFALVHSIAGNTDEAISTLEQAYESGWRGHYSLLHDPRWDELRSKSRFEQLLSATGADLDAQRSEVEAIDSSESFAARFENISQVDS